MSHENFYYNSLHNLSDLLSFLTIDLDLCLIFIPEDVKGKLGQYLISTLTLCLVSMSYRPQLFKRWILLSTG